MEFYEHVGQARFLMGILNQPPISGNMQLLSEVMWGVATQMLKAVAKMNDLPCETHREMFRAVRAIGETITPDVELIREFGRAGELHKNFYDGEMSRDEIVQGRAMAAKFIVKMQRIIDTG